VIDNRVRSAVVERVYDGDTLFLTIDVLLFKIADQSCRLAGLNTREIGMEGAVEARDFLRSLVPTGMKVTAMIVRLDKYAGRFDGRIYRPDGSCVNDLMVASGYAVPWNGTGAAPIPPYPPVVNALGRSSKKWEPA